MGNPVQVGVFIGISLLIAFITYLHCRKGNRKQSEDGHDLFLAGGGLAWYFVAGSITLTNLSTDQLVGMNGNQMFLLAWWELAAVLGLFILAFVFLPIYYRNHCTTTTELLQKKYNDKHIRALISVLFLLGNIIIFLPIVLYSGSLTLKEMFGLDNIPLLWIAAVLAIIGAAYAILGGLKAVAVSDTYSGVLVLSLALLVAFLALKEINFSLEGIPKERLSMVGGNNSPIPWHTLLTGMIFIQTFYWSTNQVITQRAMAAPNIKEAQKGVLTAAGIRLMIVPIIVTLPGVVAYKLFGDIGDVAYGRIITEILPPWLIGAFAAALTAAVLTSYNSNINASAALLVCDLYEPYIGKSKNIRKISTVASVILMVLSVAFVPMYMASESLINILQERFGFLSMPILSAFIVGLVFRNVNAKAAIIGVVSGVAFYGYLTLVLKPFHYIHCMFLTLIFCIAISLLSNLIIFKKVPSFAFGSAPDQAPAE